MLVNCLKGKYFIYKREEKAEAKFKTELSKLIIDEYGRGPFHKKCIVNEIITFALNYYITKFKEICHNEKSVQFYQNIFRFHEQATELVYLYPHKDISSDINSKYIAQYRRTLKFILEMGCEVQMVTRKVTSEEIQERTEHILDDLLFLGEMILMSVNLYAEQIMIDDAIHISFDKHGLYVFSRQSCYESLFEYFIRECSSHLEESVIDEKGLEDLKEALRKYFKIEYENVQSLIACIHEENEPKGGEVVGVGWETLPNNLHDLFKVPLTRAEQFFTGLRLDRSNKMDLVNLACKPYKLNRYLYRPIIIWNIDGRDYALFGKNSWGEAFTQYVNNAIPWGKAPQEWMEDDGFKKYVHTKENEHDKWLEDAVEKILQNQKLLYDRNVKSLKSSKGSVNIDVKGVGEVDFIIVAEEVKKIYISDCKHLLGRYDLVDQKNDYNVFAVGTKKNKSYNETMSNKLVWFNKMKDLVQEHFRIKYNNPNFCLDGYSFEGIFIVNTPTFYMYNAEYRIYTITQIEKVVIGKFTDPTFVFVIEEDGYQKRLCIKYPYFQKPT